MITKETSDFSSINFHTGETILIDKPPNLTSFKVVEIIRNIVGVKAGHAGTLDPLATGLLIVCTGRMTKKISTFKDLDKTYTGKIILGKSSPSLDFETEVTEEKPFNEITEDEIYSARDQFIGEIMQVPPMYSALKINGQTLYRLARKGKTINREPRKATIHKFEIKQIALPEINFEITCSKGTYIRAIANDLGEKLGCGGILGLLRRTHIGDYSVDNALQVEVFVDREKKYQDEAKAQEQIDEQEKIEEDIKEPFNKDNNDWQLF